MNKIKMILILLLLSGCSSSKTTPKVNYFLLGNAQTIETPKVDAQKVRLQHIDLAVYLDRQNMLFLDKNNQIHIANYFNWSAPLSRGIKRSLQLEMNLIDSDIYTVDHCKDCTSVALRIDHFYPTFNKVAIISGVVTYTNANAKIKTMPFYFEQGITAPGYKNSVPAMNKLIERLADKIIHSIPKN